MHDSPRTIVITGAAGGIGRAVSSRLLSEGFALALIDRDADGLDGLAASLSADRPGSVTTHPADLTDAHAIDRAIVDIFSAHAQVVGLFANAGYAQFASFLETDQRNWDRHVSVNLSATFSICQRFVHALLDAGPRPASIVINASSAAHQYSKDLFSYSVTKAGLVMMMKAMATELGGFGIRANAIMPGVIETGMTQSALEDAGARAGMVGRTPIGRLGVPDDIAALAAFLLSDESGFITGAAVPIDGGQTLVGEPQWL